MKCCIIACVCAETNGIGKNGEIPWHNKEDLAYFRFKTSGNIVVMGRKTYDSLRAPLPNRMNIVITSKPENYTSTDHVLFTRLENIYTVLDRLSSEYSKCYVIGGAQIYQHFIDKASRLYLTRLYRKFECDTFFPGFTCSFFLVKASENFYHKDDDYFFRYEKYMSILVD